MRFISIEQNVVQVYNDRDFQLFDQDFIYIALEIS